MILNEHVQGEGEAHVFSTESKSRTPISLFNADRGAQAAEPHPLDDAAYRPEQTYKLPNHSSKTVLSIVKIGPPTGTRT